MEGYVTKNQKKLRFGITTGTCSAAAAKAAAQRLLFGMTAQSVRIDTPKGISVLVPVQQVSASAERCECRVIKDSGDDPDVTDGMPVCVSVERLKGEPGQTAFTDERYPQLFLEGGQGVGRVTREGLEQRLGQAAINAVPRSMIFQAVGEVCSLAEVQEWLLITVRLPEGEALAGRTFNPRLGILGGLSVLGTSGILEPMSERAIVDTIELEIRQLTASGERNLLVTPGNYGQAYASQYLHLDLEKSVKCSNYVGDTLDLAVAYGAQRLLLVGNVGKLVKLAAGIMNTHSKTADGRGEIFALHAVLCGGSREMACALLDCINTEEMLRALEAWGLRQAVMESICRKIRTHVQARVGGKLEVGVALFSEKYGFLGQTEGTQQVLEHFLT